MQIRENVSQDEKTNTYGGPRQRKATGTTAEYECATSAGAQAREWERTAGRPIGPMHKTSPRGAIGVSREGDTSLSREAGSNECPQRGSNRSNTSGKRWGQTTPNKIATHS